MARRLSGGMFLALVEEDQRIASVPGMALPAGASTDGEGEPGWEGEGAGCVPVIGPALKLQ